MTPATQRATELLKQLISTPSHTRDEGATADLLASFLEREGVEVERIHNNLIARSEHFDPTRDTLLLNSHHDTVRPAASYTHDPYAPITDGERLYGLGANDAGASLVCLLETFLTLRTATLPFNLMLLLSAEEECGGEKGVRAVMPLYGEQITMAIVGEPTSMQAAVAERGLVVVDCVAKGISGHAARSEGVNALYIALDDIARLRDFRFERESKVLGPIHLT
ncbi:MAG: M20/M25/M40 family metallo-hydrolase, partial [Alistipes sp.]|nr:M20/M25/M40 family metallo-hydrolase [Alistipes sp.]